MLQVTQTPPAPVSVGQQFSISGKADPQFAGQTLRITVDGQLQGEGGLIQPDGTWQTAFQFQSVGDRRIAFQVGDNRLETLITVVSTQPRLRFTQVPANLYTYQPATFAGVAENYPDGTQLLLRADRQFELSRPTVQAGLWQSSVGFTQPGSRVIEILSPNGQDRAETSVQIVSRPLLRFTQVPTTLSTLQAGTVAGVADFFPDGTQLVLRADGQFELDRPVVQAGNWQSTVRFNQAGKRVIEILTRDGQQRSTASIEVILRPRVRFTQIPTTLPAFQAATLSGVAESYADGTRLLLRADRSFELDRPTVQAGAWRSTVSFNQTGNRLIEIMTADGQDRSEATIQVTAAVPRPPRVSFTNPPQQVKAEETVTFRGKAENYQTGDELILRADQKLILARPRVQAGLWQATTVLREAGDRLIEIIGSEQDRAQTMVKVAAAPSGSFQVLPRSTWTSNPTPAAIPDMPSPKRITMHHTFLSNAPAANASQATEAERMRQIWSGHVNGNGWSDIGYHFIIMPSGRVYSARAENKRGAHDVVNDGLGIAFDGIYTSQTINQQQFNAAVALCTLLSKRYGFLDPVTPVPTPTADFGTRNLPLICGHRDRVATECPGSSGGSTIRLSDIRQAVKANLA